MKPVNEEVVVAAERVFASAATGQCYSTGPEGSHVLVGFFVPAAEMNELGAALVGVARRKRARVASGGLIGPVPEPRYTRARRRG